MPRAETGLGEVAQVQGKENPKRQWNSTLPARKAGLKRTGFKRKEWPAFSADTKPTKPRPTLGKGKKTKEWDRVRAKLKPMFERAGITCCELGYPGCWRDNGLGFAHAKKRRNLKPEELDVVILACSANCHEIIERLPEPQMGEIVMAVIAARAVQPF